MPILALQPAIAFPAPLVWGVAFAFGLNVGSFLNVVAHRLPMGLSVVRPRSRCPACRSAIGALDNIPVVSWLLLGGRCRGCKGRISARYPAVELMSGALAALVVHLLVVVPGLTADPWAWAHAVAVFLVTAAMLAASLIDFDHTILPDEITIGWMWPAPVVAALLPQMTLGAALEVPSWFPEFGAHWPVRVIAAVASIAGIAVGAGVVWAVRAVGSAVAGKEAMGFGDVKFHGMIGGFTGPVGSLLALILACVVGAVVGIVRMLVTKNRYLPFGPYLAIGGFIAMVRGAEFVDWYLGLLRG